MESAAANEARFKAGFVEAHLFDEERKSWSGRGPRPLRCAIWYPAGPEESEGAPASLAAEEPLFLVGEVVDRPPLAASAERFPVVLLSHGTGGSALSIGWLGIGLAEQGYVVVAVNHHGNTAIEPYLPEGFLCWWERARDLTVALDRIMRDERFAGRLDPTRVFAAGFSLGGYTALALAGAVTDLEALEQWIEDRSLLRGPREFPDLVERIEELRENNPQYRQSLARHGSSYLDPRVKAVFAMSPAPTVRAFTIESLSAIEVPVCLMVGQSDEEAPHDQCACWLERHLADCELILLGESVGHYVFLCEATERGKRVEPAICIDAPGVDRRQIHERAVTAALDLFRRTSPLPERVRADVRGF